MSSSSQLKIFEEMAPHHGYGNHTGDQWLGRLPQHRCIQLELGRIFFLLTAIGACQGHLEIVWDTCMMPDLPRQLIVSETQRSGASCSCHPNALQKTSSQTSFWRFDKSQNSDPETRFSTIFTWFYSFRAQTKILYFGKHHILCCCHLCRTKTAHCFFGWGLF